MNRTWLYLITIGLLLTFSTLPPAWGNPQLQEEMPYREILILFPGIASGPISNSAMQGFFKEWDQHSPRSSVYLEYGELDRHPGSNEDEQFIKHLVEKYKGKKFNAILAPHPASAILAGKVYAALAAECPLILVKPDMPGVSFPLFDNQYTLLLPQNFEKTLAAAKSLQPELRRIVVIVGDVWARQFKLQEYAQKVLKPILATSDLLIAPADNLEETKRIVAELTEEDAVLFIEPMTDNQGRALNEQYWNRFLAQRSKVPVYSVVDTLKPGQPLDNRPGSFVGGYMVDTEVLGTEVAKCVMSILEGQLADTRVISLAANKMIFDYNGLERFGYLSRELPANAVLINKPFSFYEAYKELVIGTVSLIGVLIAFILILIKNILQRQEAERVLQQAYNELTASELRFQLAAEAAENAIFDLDLRTGKYLTLSKRSGGIRLPDITTALEEANYIHPDDMPLREAAFQAYMRGEKPIYEIEYRIKNACGEWRWALVRGKTISEIEGKPVRMVGALVDITHLKEAHNILERQVAARTRELVQAMMELEAFTYTVSHDIKSPLRAIAGYARFLHADYAQHLDVNGLTMLTTIRDKALDMIRFVNRLLEYSRTSRLPVAVEIVDLGSLFDSVFQELLAECPERTVVFEIKNPLPVLQGDRILLREVVLNILSNAFKFTRNRPTARICVGCERQKQEYVFAVQDNGVGFDMQYADKLFGIFERLHSVKEFEGYGIGLATVRKIIQKHGGRTWIDGRLDHGTVIRFSLPLEKDKQIG